MPSKKSIQDKTEREYTIPLRKEWRKVPRYKRAAKAIKAIKEFLVQHMRIYDRDLRKIKIDGYLNEFVWFRGIRKPPAQIKIKAVLDGEFVRVGLAQLPDKLKFKKLREEKREKTAEESGKKKKELKKQEEKPEVKGSEESEEKKVEEEQKKSAVVEAGKEIEKTAAKQMKHQTGGKTKEPKRQKRMALQK